MNVIRKYPNYTRVENRQVSWQGVTVGVNHLYNAAFFGNSIYTYFGRADTQWLPISKDEPLHEGCPFMLIFHIGRCGSTLVCNLLQEVPNTIVVKEDTSINKLLQDIIHYRRFDYRETCNIVNNFLCMKACAIRQQIKDVPGYDENVRIVFKLTSWVLTVFPMFKLLLDRTKILYISRDPGVVTRKLQADAKRRGRMVGWSNSHFNALDPSSEESYKKWDNKLKSVAQKVFDYSDDILGDDFSEKLLRYIGVEPTPELLERLNKEKQNYSKKNKKDTVKWEGDGVKY